VLPRPDIPPAWRVHPRERRTGACQIFSKHAPAGRSHEIAVVATSRERALPLRTHMGGREVAKTKSTLPEQSRCKQSQHTEAHHDIGQIVLRCKWRVRRPRPPWALLQSGRPGTSDATTLGPPRGDSLTLTENHTFRLIAERT